MTSSRPRSSRPAIDAPIVLVAIVGVSTVVATIAYRAASDRVSARRAIGHGEAIRNVERSIGLDQTAGALQRSLGSGASGELLSLLYWLGYWPFLGAGIIVVAWRRRRVLWRLLASIAISGLVGVAVMFVYPTAPPRLLGEADVVQRSRWASVAHPDSVMNPYAAMPSFHVAWSLLTTLGLLAVVGERTARRVIAAQPIVMSVVVVATANHWFLDVAAGAVLAGASWAAAPFVVRSFDAARARDSGRDSARRNTDDRQDGVSAATPCEQLAAQRGM